MTRDRHGRTSPISMGPLVSLGPGGAPATPTAVIDWVNRVVLDVHQRTHSVGPFSVHLRPYRCGAHVYLACDVLDEHSDSCYDMTFCIGVRPDLTSPSAPEVPDMPDALHLVSLVVEALGATVRLESSAPRAPT